MACQVLFWIAPQLIDIALKEAQGGSGAHPPKTSVCPRGTWLGSKDQGLAHGSLDKAACYVQERMAFGQPLAKLQGVQMQLGEMATRVELARQLAYKAAWQLDNGKIDPKVSAMAKFYAGETAVQVADKALQLHGGYGYIDEYDIPKFSIVEQDVKAFEPQLRDFLVEFDECFSRSEPRENLYRYLVGQFSQVERKSIEPIAQQVEGETYDQCNYL